MVFYANILDFKAQILDVFTLQSEPTVKDHLVYI